MRLLELGCGLGFPSLALALSHPNNLFVTMSDQEPLVSLMEENIRLNGIDETKARAIPLDWDNEDHLSSLLSSSSTIDNNSSSSNPNPTLSSSSSPFGPPFDFIIASDVVYEPLYGESWRDFVKVVKTISSSSPNLKIILASGYLFLLLFLVDFSLQISLSFQSFTII